MEMFIQNEFRRCQNTGSYRNNSYRNPFQLILSYYQFTKRMTGNLEIKCKQYNESNGSNRLIIYMRAQIKVTFKGKQYPVVKQVVFPSNFPLVPPIYSVINWDSKKYDVHEFYYHNILPDESYEVKLNSSKHFVQNLDLELMYSEFASIVGEFFPFIFRAVKPMPSVPFYYDIRYNMIGGEFPVPGKSSNVNSNPNLNSGAQDQPFNMTGINRTTSNSSSTSNSMNGQMKLYFNQIVKDLEMDCNHMETDGQSIIRKKDRYAKNYKKLNNLVEDMDNNKEIVDSKISEIKEKINEMAEDELNDNNIDNFFNYNKSNGKELVELENKLKAIIETEYVMMEVFEERDEETEKQLKSMTKLWKKEWDLKLQKKYIIDNRMY